jgi:hypothetical protein
MPAIDVPFADPDPHRAACVACLVCLGVLKIPRLLGLLARAGPGIAGGGMDTHRQLEGVGHQTAHRTHMQHCSEIPLKRSSHFTLTGL